jgi:hypothetical protein
MTLLPIVARELRVAARRRETYWTRLSLAIAAIVIGSMIFVFTVGFPPNFTGRFIFQCLAGLLFLYCLVYGRRATADSISYEKREGTLGLLFLTDLKGHDIVLGKLAATSMRGFYGLMAVFPVLAVPLLLGGITNGEFWRMVLVLVNTFLFSLAIGIFGSALSRDFRHAMGANLLFLVIYMGLGPAVGLLLSYFSGLFIPRLFFSCPAYSFYLCSDAQYALQSQNFWWSLGVSHGLTWFLILLASWVVPRAWHDQPTHVGKSTWRGFWERWNYGAFSKRAAFRYRLLNVNPFYWLASRVTRKTAHVWTFLFLMGVWWLVGWAMSGSVWFDPSVAILTVLMLNCTFKVWITIEAGQQLAEDKRAGAFELLLTVPLKVQEILQGQLLALRRQFAMPLVVVVIAELLLMALVSRRPSEYGPFFWLAGIAMLLLDITALIWVGMATALTARSHNHATFSSVTRVLGLPWAFLGLVVGTCHVYYGVALGKEWAPGTNFYVGLWFGLGTVIDLILGLTSWQLLRKRFHQLALQTRHFGSLPKAGKLEAVGPKQMLNRPQVPDSKTALTQKGETALPSKWPSRRMAKIAVVVGMALMILTSSFLIFRRQESVPPPTVVVVGPSQTGLKVSPTYGSAIFVLPDGTLWRWGQAGPGSTQAPFPEQIGTNHNWVEAAACGNHYLGLRRDGTIWEWGWGSTQRTNFPVQADPGANWLSVAVSASHSLALKQDGTIWAWGNNSLSQLGNGPGPNRTNLTQIGTNNQWLAIACHSVGSYALASNGTLWAWGGVPVFKPGPNALSTFPFPTQVANETNWSGFANDYWPSFRSRSGEIWVPFHSVPPRDSSVTASCRLLVSNSLPNGIAAAVTDIPEIFQLRSDGTLWKKPYPFNLQISNTTGVWRKVGKRADWVSLWSASGTAFGLTSDGTIWVWGYDPTRTPRHSLTSWFNMMQASIRNRFTKSPMAMSRPPRAYQKQPRPLIRMVDSEENSSTPPVSR